MTDCALASAVTPLPFFTVRSLSCIADEIEVWTRSLRVSRAQAPKLRSRASGAASLLFGTAGQGLDRAVHRRLSRAIDQALGFSGAQGRVTRAKLGMARAALLELVPIGDMPPQPAEPTHPHVSRSAPTVPRPGPAPDTRHAEPLALAIRLVSAWAVRGDTTATATALDSLWSVRDAIEAACQDNDALVGYDGVFAAAGWPDRGFRWCMPPDDVAEQCYLVRFHTSVAATWDVVDAGDLSALVAHAGPEPIRSTPMSSAEMHRASQASPDGRIRGAVRIPLERIVEANQQRFLGLCSKSLIGSILLEEVSYRLIGAEGGDALIEVCGHPRLALVGGRS